MSSSVTARFPSVRVRLDSVSASAAEPKLALASDEFADESLLARVSVGDRDALALLFRRHAGLVWRIGQRILRDKAEAEDLVQEVFLYIHSKSGLFDSSKGAARSWIVQVAYTQAFLRRRRRKAHGVMSGITDGGCKTKLQTNLRPHYESTVEGLFGTKRWHTVLDSLTEEQRETLKLHFFEGYTFSEIAEKLGQSYTNVRHHHYRGLEKLRKHLVEGQSGKR